MAGLALMTPVSLMLHNDAGAAAAIGADKIEQCAGIGRMQANAAMGGPAAKPSDGIGAMNGIISPEKD